MEIVEEGTTYICDKYNAKCELYFPGEKIDDGGVNSDA